MITPQEKYTEAESNLTNLKDALIPLMLNRDTNQEELGKTNIMGQLAEQQVNKMKPKENTFFNLSKNESRYSYNPNNGKTQKVADNKIEDAKDNPLDKKIDEYIDTKNNRVLIFQKTNGETYEKSFGKVRETRSNNSNKVPEDKSLKDSTSKLIADLKNFKPYNVDEFGNKTPMSS